ncbi:MAG: hypothetical protein C0598_11160 [Marinilabiliales bacterium]|nr:MAG: hypothetical protein C0598_11160 [Marinilabiliales bacterium]
MNKEKEYLDRISNLQNKIKEFKKKEDYFRTLEKKYKSANDLLSATERIAKVGGWELNLKTNFLSWTDETKRIHEVDPNYQPTLEKAIDFYYGETNKKIISNAVNNTINDGTPFDLELEIVSSKGNLKNVHALGSAFHENGKIIKVYGTFQDITERKKLEEKLNNTNRLLKNTEKIGKVGGWQFDPKTLKQIWSEEIFRILEYDNFDKAPEVPKGIDFIDEEFRPQANKAIEAAITEGRPYNQVWRVTTLKGNKKWVRAVAEPTIINGEIINIAGAFHDITNLKENEEELKALNQQLSANEQQLRAANQQLSANEQQLRASNEELLANDEHIKTINQQLRASEQQLINTNTDLILAQNIAKLGYWSFDIKNQTPTWTDEVFKMYNIPVEKGEPTYENQKKLVHP